MTNRVEEGRFGGGDQAPVADVSQMHDRLRGFLLNVTSNVAAQRQEEGADTELLDRIEAEIASFETRLSVICQQCDAEELERILSGELSEEIYDAINETLNLLLSQEYAKARESEDRKPAPSVEEIIGEYRLTLIESLRLLALARDNGVDAETLEVLQNNADNLCADLGNVAMFAWQYTPEQLTQLEAGVDALYVEIKKHLPDA